MPKSQYDWTADDDHVSAERIPVDVPVDVEIIRVYYVDRKGQPYLSRSNDPKIMIVLADDTGREAAEMITLSDKAAWKIKSLLKAAGADLHKMKADGVEPYHFADQEFGNANLIGRRLKIKVDKYVDDKGNLCDATAIRAKPADAAPPEINTAAPPPEESPSKTADIPPWSGNPNDIPF